MNRYLRTTSIFAAATFFAASFINAQTATTDPVGYVTATVSSNSDLKVGVPMTQAPTFAGAVDSVSTGTINVTSNIPDVTTAPHFIWVTTGSIAGQWYEITGSTASSVTVAEDLATAGLAATDKFSILPFWTIGDLLPNGGGLPTTANPGTPQSFVLLNDVTQVGINLPAAGGSYFPFDNGTVSGWLDASNPVAFVDDTVLISPATYLTLRNVSGSTASVQFVGSVPVTPLAIEVASRAAGDQDNQVYLSYPSDVLLGDLGLETSGAVSSTNNPGDVTDFLLVFSQSTSGLNPSTTGTYFHFDNGSVSGWLDASNPVSFIGDSLTIPAGSALIIRKGASSDAVVNWAAPVPYTL